MIRLFIALKTPDEVRKKIIEFRNEALPDYRKYDKWEPEDKIHLTLKFIGEVKPELSEQIADHIKFVSEYEKFICSLTQFGFFYKQKAAKILWVGLSIDNLVFDLVNRLNEELEKFSIVPEKRKFHAHLTIKRLKGTEGQDFISSFERFKIPAYNFVSAEIALMKSELSPAGSKYTDIKIYNLK